MAIKSKNKENRVKLFLLVVATFIVSIGLWTVLVIPNAALADHKPGHNPGGGGGGGGEETPLPCVAFDDLVGDSVQSDGQDPYDPDKGLPYCNDKEAKIGVTFTSDGHLSVSTSTSAKVGTGRSLYVDFGTDVVLAPGTANEMTIQTTEDALSDPRTLAVTASMGVGSFQGEAFNFFTMEEGVPHEHVNLSLRLGFYFADRGRYGILLRLAPEPLDGSTRDCPSSDPVTVTYLGANDTGTQTWTVETQPVIQGACISQSGEGEFGDANLLNVITEGLAQGHVALNFGFIVTAAP